ncbi:TetR/AcrR family transcriptional regulator [Ornithinimicrobium flavum]|uniref:TetR/AcrR family transcriptional regulator n=1 Tax=Ornithinimicrobium flavum TaxID=1288636 RepID=UPI00106FC47C|nr:TetR/AcrR family transcriptional regulator [Ornithinimicrobium flavum]
MPRITEATVAEHHSARERQLLDAAHTILLETGRAPTMAQVAARAGLARSSVYQYFASTPVLLQAMVRDIYPRWTAHVAEVMDAAPTDADRVLAYAVASVELVARGAHAVAGALVSVIPTDDPGEQAARMHQEVQEPLVRTLETLGVESPREVSELVNGVVHAATRLLESGTDLPAVLAQLAVVLGPLVSELGGSGDLAFRGEA